MGWGTSLRSCDALLKRVESNDPKLNELVILPMKTFTDDDCRRLSMAIANGTSTNLRSISASGHQLRPEALKTLGLAMSTQSANLCGSSSSGLSYLAIGSKDMGDEGVRSLCEGLEGSSGALLQHLDLAWKNISGEGAAAVGKAFSSSSNLRHLDLSRNEKIENGGLKALVDAARIRNEAATVLPSLEVLNIAECSLVGPAGVQSLMGLLGEGTRSKRLDLVVSSNPIGPAGCAVLSQLCSADSGSMVCKLLISKCAIGNEGIEALVSSSHPCTGMMALDIVENDITEIGAKSLAHSFIETFPDLVELKLAKNNIGGDGVESFFCAIEGKSHALDNLDLSCTNCGVEGLRAALRSSNISTLRLFGNKLGSDGLDAAALLLRGGHPSIVNLDLGGQNSEEKSVVALLESIAQKTGCGFESKLAVLEIGGNEFGDAAMEALDRLKKAHPGLDVAHDKPVRDGEES